MLATTGTYPGPDGRDRFPVSPELPLGVARSLVGSLDPTPRRAGSQAGCSSDSIRRPPTR